jgi:hypothetical protein
MACIYLALFTWVATFSEGRRVLADFAARADPLFAHHFYIANVILMPVNKIVKHLMDISVLEGFLAYEEMTTNSTKYHKYRLLLYYYITKRYIEALTICSLDSDCWDGRDGDSLGESIDGMQGVTKVLRNLPREYQRWNKCYSEAGNQEKQPGKQRGKGKPFDVKVRIHYSFQQAAARNADSERQEVMLDACWDPLKIAQGFSSGKIDMSSIDTDFCRDKCQLYREGEAILPGSKTGKHTNEPVANNTRKRKQSTPTEQSPTAAKNTIKHIPESEMPSTQPAEASLQPVLAKATVRRIISDNIGNWPGSPTIKKSIAKMCSKIAKGFVEELTGESAEDDEPMFTSADIPSCP